MNRCFKYFSVRVLIFFDLEFKGGNGCFKFCFDFIGELFNNFFTRLLFFWCGSIWLLLDDGVNIDNDFVFDIEGFVFRIGDILWVGEGGGVIVVVSFLCFFSILFNRCVSNERILGILLSNNLCILVFFVMFKFFFGEVIFLDVVWSIIKLSVIVEGCWSN